MDQPVIASPADVPLPTVQSAAGAPVPDDDDDECWLGVEAAFPLPAAICQLAFASRS